MHGALLSGLREAGRVADQYLGCPYAPPPGAAAGVTGDGGTMWSLMMRGTRELAPPVVRTWLRKKQ